MRLCEKRIVPAGLVLAALCTALAPLAAQERLSIAVMDLKVTKLPEDEVELLVDFLNHSLFETGVFDVIQQARRDSLIEEIQFSYTDASDAAKTRELGKLLSSEFLVFGSIGQLGTKILLNLATVEVETGKTVSSFSRTYGTLEDVAQDFELIAEETARFALRASFMKKAELLVAEDFDTVGEWLEDGLLFCEGGEYHIYSPDSDYYTWKLPSVDDFVYEASARWLGGETDSGYGIIFRAVDGDNYYLFDVTQNGFYKLDKKIDGEYYEITPWVRSSAVNPDARNVLKVEAVGKNISLYINNFKVEDLVDDTFDQGEFGFFSAGGVHAAFDDVRLYRGNLLIYNGFTRGAEDWFVDETAVWADGEYRLQPEAGGYYSWRGEVFENISYKADTRWMSGATNVGYGLVFRIQDIDNHYIFMISANGYYRLGMYRDNNWTDLIPWTRSRLVNQEGKNTLRVETQGSRFRLFLNENLAAEHVDGTFASGHVGFVTTDDVNAAFDNVEIFLLE